ncbi:MAG: sugar ABC transporter permease [Chloroflexi bacterium]|nr:sugar ABC transporter permease [Chloroflexota bacterium]MBU1747983.1 sugar ABC transporter permease [Chloroflexota bacterium]
MSKQRRREAIEGYLFLLPNLLGFLLFMAIPLGLSLYYSFTTYDLFTEPAPFVWLDQYIKALGFSIRPDAYQAALAAGKPWLDAVGSLIKANDDLVWVALKNSGVYAVGVLIISIPLAFMLAWLLNSRLRGMTFFRGLYYIPVVASVVGAALVWFWIYQPQAGVLNFIISAIVHGLNVVLGPLGIHVADPVIGWLRDSQWALLSLVIMTAWRTIGWDMVIFLAALQAIPSSILEAALVDGAGRGYTLRKIIIPLVTPSIFFVLVTNTIDVLQVFAEPFIMTQGGPANSTLTIGLYLYREGFQRFNMGYAAALAWIVFGIIFAITTVQFRVASRWVYEE